MIRFQIKVGLLLTTIFWLIGCSQLPLTHQKDQTKTKPMTLYDYQLIDSQTEKILSFEQLISQLKNSDVVFIGEFHGHAASHLLQSQIQQALYAENPNQILSMEQFERDVQPVLNQYLYDEIGENKFIDNSRAWNNYAGSYRPLVEFAKQNGLDIIAANAPADIVRCVGREGKNYLTKLDKEEKSWVSKAPFNVQPAYETKFKNLMNKQKSKIDSDKLNNSYQAQLLRDNTMAESIYLAKQHNPSAQIIHLNGSFHSNEYLGTVAELKRLNADLTISVISPVMLKPADASYSPQDLKLGDVLYLVASLPVEYLNTTERTAAMKKMFEKSAEKACK